MSSSCSGLSENIRVRSIIGRFLEHARIYCFRNDRQYDVYLSSADWMDRNFFRRVELAFPILDKRLKKRVLSEGLKIYLADNSNAWVMDEDGNYHRRTHRGAEPRAAQSELLHNCWRCRSSNRKRTSTGTGGLS